MPFGPVFHVIVSLHTGKASSFSEKGGCQSFAYTDLYQGRGHSSRPTAILINIHEPLI